MRLPLFLSTHFALKMEGRETHTWVCVLHGVGGQLCEF